MDNSSNSARLPLLGRILSRVLDHRKHLDYVWITAFAACPLIYAWWIGAHKTFDSFAAYDGQWPLMVLLLTAAVFLLRWTMAHIAPVSAPWPPPSLPAIVGLIDTEDGKKSAYEALRRALLSPKIVIAALLVTTVIHVVDLQQLAGFYIAGPSEVCETQKNDTGCAKVFDSGSRKELSYNSFTVERDWSVMFLSSERKIGKWQNLALNLSAYSIQFCLILTAIVLVLLILRHNLFFLFRIYQRRRVPADQEYSYIHIDLDDDDKCFGFRRANDAFNTQVLTLFIAGLFILFTRFNNVSPGSGLFPDAGQWISVFFWLVALAMVALPIGVKLLPRLLPGSDRSSASIVGYLREFLSDDAWASGNDPSSEEVAAVAARFAENSFWPTGNNRARQLFFVSLWVFFVGLVPDPRAIEIDSLTELGDWSMFVSWGVSGGLAWGSTLLLFAFLRGMLSYVDERLVQLPQHPIADEATRRQRRIPIGLFISYRRTDTAPYAGRLRDSLAVHIDQGRIFMDIDSISGGIDFQHAIEESIESAQAMLVMIGVNWLEIEDEHGRPRIQNAEDFVRLEIASGLKAGLRVFPVLVGGAAMPLAADLPDDLKAVVRLNACEIGNARWDHDVGKLLGYLEELRIPEKRGG
jgi:hypothetical protein